MSNFSASVPTHLMAATNDALELLGHGPNNFSVPAYAGPTASFALLHAWGDPVFQANVAAQPGVVIQEGIPVPPPKPGDPPSTNEDPIAMTSAVAATAGTEWGGDALPLTGVVTPGLYLNGTVLWYVIQTYDTATWPDPAVVPALVRMAKIPGQALPWVQPIDQFDAYKLVNPFTGAGDLSTDAGFQWYVTQADGAGNNVWEPGVFGWTKNGTAPQDYITYNADPVFYNGQGLING